MRSLPLLAAIAMLAVPSTAAATAVPTGDRAARDLIAEVNTTMRALPGVVEIATGSMRSGERFSVRSEWSGGRDRAIRARATSWTTQRFLRVGRVVYQRHDWMPCWNRTAGEEMPATAPVIDLDAGDHVYRARRTRVGVVIRVRSGGALTNVLDYAIDPVSKRLLSAQIVRSGYLRSGRSRYVPLAQPPRATRPRPLCVKRRSQRVPGRAVQDLRHRKAVSVVASVGIAPGTTVRARGTIWVTNGRLDLVEMRGVFRGKPFRMLSRPSARTPQEATPCASTPGDVLGAGELAWAASTQGLKGFTLHRSGARMRYRAWSGFMPFRSETREVVVNARTKRVVAVTSTRRSMGLPPSRWVLRPLRKAPPQPRTTGAC